MDNIINLDDENVYQTDLKVNDARELVNLLPEGAAYDDLSSELDEAQADVFAGNKEIAYLVITITK